MPRSWLRRRRLSRTEQGMVEEILLTAIDPFLERWTVAERRAALPGYVMRQTALCAALVEKVDLDATRLTDVASLDRTWAYFVAHRRTLRRHHPMARSRQQALNGLPASLLFDVDTALLLEELGALFGAAIQQAFPAASWQVLFAPDDDLPLNGKPCLAPIPGPFARINPAAVVNTLAFRSLGGDSATALSELFTRWTTFGPRAASDAAPAGS